MSGMLVLAGGGRSPGLPAWRRRDVEFAPSPAPSSVRRFRRKLVKFLLLYYVVREHKDCDSGGDLFCAAMLIGLGFAGLENVLYLLASGEHWIKLGLMRGVLAMPAHTVFGCLMGMFAARAFRGQAPRAELVAGPDRAGRRAWALRLSRS